MNGSPWNIVFFVVVIVVLVWALRMLGVGV